MLCAIRQAIRFVQSYVVWEINWEMLGGARFQNFRQIYFIFRHSNSKYRTRFFFNTFFKLRFLHIHSTNTPNQIWANIRRFKHTYFIHWLITQWVRYRPVWVPFIAPLNSKCMPKLNFNGFIIIYILIYLVMLLKSKLQ